MKYADLLKSYIKKSHLTLDEISDLLRKRGLSASKQYLSRLQNGKNPPASDELNRALAEITGGDARDLIIAAYLEKAPKELEKLKSKIKMLLNDETIDYLIKMKQDMDYPPARFLKIPILGRTAAGKPLFSEENIEGFLDIPNPGKYKSVDLFALKVKGDSMTGSRIYDGDTVIVKLQPDVENGEIAVVNVNGDEITLKKVKKLDNGQILLLSTNDKYEPIVLSHEKARIIGKVIQVIFEPH